MATNTLILKMWVKEKVKILDRDLLTCNTDKDAYKIEGKLEILKEFFDDFNLESVDEKDIIIHNNI